MTEGFIATVQWTNSKLSDLKPQLLDLARFLAEEHVQKRYQKRIFAIRRSAKKFMLWNDNLSVGKRMALKSFYPLASV